MNARTKERLEQILMFAIRIRDSMKNETITNVRVRNHCWRAQSKRSEVNDLQQYTQGRIHQPS